jgi:hypothetical protein
MAFLAFGCSRQKHAVAPAQFILHAGDIASPAKLTTNNIGGVITYIIPVDFSDSQQARFFEFELKHQNQDIKMMAGPKEILEFRPIHGPMIPVSFKLPFLYHDDAQVKIDALNNLSEK